MRYTRYERQIAAEYVPIVGDVLYKAGRGAFFARMEAQPTLFNTAWGRERFEDNARRNLASGRAGALRRAATGGRPYPGYG